MDLRGFVQVLKKRWVTVVAVAAVVTVAAVLYGMRGSMTYQASAEVLIPRTTIESLIASERQPKDVEWQANFARSTETLERAAANLGDTTADQLSAMVVAAPSTATSEYLITITARSPQPAEAEAVANAVAEAYVAATVEALRTETASLIEALAGSTGQGTGTQVSAAGLAATLEQLPEMSSAQARIVRPARMPAEEAPASRALRLGVLGLTLGLALGVAAAFIAEQLDEAPAGAGARAAS